MHDQTTITAVGLGLTASGPISQSSLLQIVRFATATSRGKPVAFFGNSEESRRFYEALSALMPEIRTHFVDLWCFFHDGAIMRPNGPEHRVFDESFASGVVLTRPADYLLAARVIRLLFRDRMLVALPFAEDDRQGPREIVLGRPNPTVVNLYPFAGSNRFGPVLKALLQHLRSAQSPSIIHNMALTERIHRLQAPDIIRFGEDACRGCQALVDGQIGGVIEGLDYFRHLFFHTHVSARLIKSRPDIRFVHLIRDPRDILNSLYHYLVRCGVRDDFAELRAMDKEAALRRIIQGFVYVNRSRTFFMLVPPLKEIAATFAEIASLPNVSLVKFEDIRLDPLPAYRRLLASLGADAPPLLTIDDDDTLRSYIHLGTFEHQSGGARKDGDEADTLSGRLRKGAVGDWRNHYSQQLAEEVEALIGPELEALHYRA